MSCGLCRSWGLRQQACSKLEYGGIEKASTFVKAYVTKRGIKLTLSYLDTNFYHDFVQFLTKELEMTNGTVNNHLKRVKVVMSYALEKRID
ncbi:hypothetical protein GCM10011375_35700 [Hymenobacter qilianensis]|uniref:Uncharacterized protein n=2 Tax=Hymenobacter qilianensis TaxID=1385715 RepID=A0ACB5PW84_9BACT|nr:hypothetical protein GCM10011375_35700 [Hymenobacter qilianensis]